MLAAPTETNSLLSLSKHAVGPTKQETANRGLTMLFPRDPESFLGNNLFIMRGCSTGSRDERKKKIEECAAETVDGFVPFSWLIDNPAAVQTNSHGDIFFYTWTTSHSHSDKQTTEITAAERTKQLRRSSCARGPQPIIRGALASKRVHKSQYRRAQQELIGPQI